MGHGWRMIVITSYSIHYTKLYDTRVADTATPQSAAVMPMYDSQVFSRISGSSGKVVWTVIGSSSSNFHRITSYNVCYTKLLRLFSFSAPCFAFDDPLTFLFFEFPCLEESCLSPLKVKEKHIKIIKIWKKTDKFFNQGHRK